ncbi:putative molybdenum-pterin-binding protein Mop [Gottschalkia acidurici 9a]|uniref:Molybdenum-pterin-binding protein Mop n=1 Tax=Gottschalkia acidurici (strain ATCC 7906 / DSM 604 / BCRC 14475 / CIP 104303 / KCTC 5404 / NCIMB 10678 / 9a) TaxID=1128398 RepID=K0AYN0_GOTA9|nr:molybdopterin-binding protein [Gottschalkia acidurici]AFS77877.1 putative molybdenum-pterin-binding protein Mop [Gottschalkia acidurici 9a]
MNSYYYPNSNVHFNPNLIYGSYPYPIHPNVYQRNDKGTRCDVKISARNQLTGKVVDIEEGAVNARVVIDVGCNNLITSIITMASLRDLEITLGKTVTAFVKSSDVMIMTKTCE